MADKKPIIRKVIFIGNYSPRKCGIATFTTDLCETFAAKHPDVTCQTVAVTDIAEGYPYPERVRFEIREQDLASYKQAAEFINLNNTDVVCLQHEYGIFGGKAGSYVLTLLHAIEAPVVTTFHTVLKNPSQHQELVLKEIAEVSQIIVVMTSKAAQLLTDRYGIATRKIRILPHGIPEIPFLDTSFYKDQFAVEGKTVLLTFGLLSPNKGIEYVIRALPQIVKRFPEVIYIILGQTHPNLIRSEGENYRIRLQQLATELGVEQNVRFHNRFVTLDDLKEFLVTADIYITPYLNEEQVVSGTLAYSFGAGNAVVSTPFWHAEELLCEGKGALVPFRDEEAIGREIIGLLGDDAKRNAMRKRAFLLGKEMTWPSVATKYLEVFKEARINKPASVRPVKLIEPLKAQTRDLPALKLDHLVRMTDSAGLFQHARFSIPNFSEGYCTDDNARGLILVSLLEEGEAEPAATVNALGHNYLAFLHYAFNDENGRFRNFMDFRRTWLDRQGSEDSHGRAIWALGTCIGRTRHVAFRQLAAELFDKAVTAAGDLSAPRACAFSLIGIHEYFRRFAGDRRTQTIRHNLSIRLHEMLRANSDAQWKWFEQTLTYDNARLPHALIMSGRWLPDGDMLRDGLGALRWLCDLQTDKRGNFQPVGADGFYTRNGPFPLFDQQPLEAHSTVAACLEAYRTTKDTQWYDEAWRAFQWYLGRNHLSISLYDPVTGGCCDALHVDRANLNQGAEATLSFLLSLTEMNAIQNDLQSLKEPVQ